MRKINYILFVLLFALVKTNAQTTYVPDYNFERELINLGYDSGIPDTYVPTANISGITTLILECKNISDLTGIEDFVSLTKLNCYDNNITTLDLSKNTALTFLDCQINNLSSLDLSANATLTTLRCQINNLTSINLSASTVLNVLYCYENKLTSIDISANTALTYFDCRDNQLTSLDVSANKALTNLRCQYNNLSNIDVSVNTSLTTLGLSMNQLTSLDVSANTALTSLTCGQNQLTSLDVSANTELTGLLCYGNQLTDLDVSANTNLTNLTCSINQLTSLDLSANTALIKLYCNSNQLTSLDVRNTYNENVTVFNASNNPNLTCIYVDDKTASYLLDWTIDATSNFVNDETDCSAITSTDKIITVEDFIIYPNPTKGILRIDFSENNVEKLEITDITGKIVFIKNHFQQHETVDLSRFANGIYVVKLHTDKGSISSKIIKD